MKIVLGKLVCNAEQLATGVCVCEGPDAQTVGRIQLSLEELTAGLLDLRQLEKAGGREQRLHVSLLYSHLGAGRRGYQIATKLRVSRPQNQSFFHFNSGSLIFSVSSGLDVVVPYPGRGRRV